MTQTNACNSSITTCVSLPVDRSMQHYRSQQCDRVYGTSSEKKYI